MEKFMVTSEGGSNLRKLTNAPSMYGSIGMEKAKKTPVADARKQHLGTCQ